jgi:hypothetical protein
MPKANRSDRTRLMARDGLCLAKTWYTYKINDLARSWIRAFPLKLLP